MKYINTNFFKKVALPESLIEILELTAVHSLHRRNVYLWRGQGNIEWPIDSSAYRRLIKSDSSVTEKNIQTYEQNLLNHATHQGYRYENGRMLSDFELLAKLQHHGAATRLIDCSRNILVALWFACTSQKNDTGLLFGIHSNYLGGGENDPEDRGYKKIFKGLEAFHHPQTWQPPVVTKRIAAQGAQFLYSTISDSVMGSLAMDDSEEAYLPIAISSELKSELIVELSSSFDINYLTLFPDIDGFGYANSINFEEYENERW